MTIPEYSALRVGHQWNEENHIWLVEQIRELDESIIALAAYIRSHSERKPMALEKEHA